MDIFETGFLVIVPVGLVLVMFGMGLSLGIDDFRRVFEFPRAALLGIVGQLLLLPALAFALTAVVEMPQDIAVGLIIIAACPGGVASNVIVYAARADVALSVTLTALNSTITVFTIPFVVSLGLAMHMGDSGTVPDMPILQTIARLFSITVSIWSAGIKCANHKVARNSDRNLCAGVGFASPSASASRPSSVMLYTLRSGLPSWGTSSYSTSPLRASVESAG